MSDYEQPQASYPEMSPPVHQEKRECKHYFKDVTAFGSPYRLHICVWCGERKEEQINVRREE